jgi:hypothetical protein
MATPNNSVRFQDGRVTTSGSLAIHRFLQLKAEDNTSIRNAALLRRGLLGGARNAVPLPDSLDNMINIGQQLLKPFGVSARTVTQQRISGIPVGREPERILRFVGLQMKLIAEFFQCFGRQTHPPRFFQNRIDSSHRTVSSLELIL